MSDLTETQLKRWIENHAIHRTTWREGAITLYASNGERIVITADGDESAHLVAWKEVPQQRSST